MKVTIVGGGPAGLYLAILLRKADDAVDVQVLERNAPDATFGWGVVFSEETLGALRDADHESYLAITDTFARWDRVDIRYRGRILRSRGHSFSAISRIRLLEILHERCRALGAELRFGCEVEAVPTGADLVVGADGVNSIVRRVHEQHFGTRIVPEGCKYVWFGTDLVFDAFTFVFRETEHGLFQVLTRSTSARARSSSNVRNRRGGAPAWTSSTRTRASPTASGSSPATSRATSSSPTVRSG
jgi:anthraniloyl-CoA monooxygenase